MAAVNERFLLQCHLFLILALKRQRRRKKHKCWVGKIFQERKQRGFYHTLVRELRMHDREYFYR